VLFEHVELCIQCLLGVGLVERVDVQLAHHGELSDSGGADPFYHLANQVEQLHEQIDERMQHLRDDVQDRDPGDDDFMKKLRQIETSFREIFSALSDLSANHRRHWLDGAFDREPATGGER